MRFWKPIARLRGSAPTAKRIWDRIREEVPGCTAAERTVRLYVEQRKEELGLTRLETFVPQSYDWVSRRRSIGMKPMPIWMANGSSFRSSRCVRWPVERPIIAPICEPTQQAFLEAHELAFIILVASSAAFVTTGDEGLATFFPEENPGDTASCCQASSFPLKPFIVERQDRVLRHSVNRHEDARFSRRTEIRFSTNCSSFPVESLIPKAREQMSRQAG